MAAPTRASRDADALRQLCAASLRAEAADPALDLRGGYLFRGGELLPLGAPHLYPRHGEDSLGSFRGAVDGMALRLRHSDAALHAGLAPEGTAAAAVFDLLEQYRAESLAPPLPGWRANLRARHVEWSRRFHASGLTETDLGMFLYTVAQVCRSRLTGEPVLPDTEDAIEGMRVELVGAAGIHLGALRTHRHDQRAFAPHALHLARLAQERADPDDARVRRPRPGRRAPDFSLFVPLDEAAGDYGSAGDGTPSPALAAHGYRRFTTAYDRTLPAASLVRADALRGYREAIDGRVAAAGLNVPRLARQLEALLCLPEPDGFDGGHEEGHLDGGRLAQLVASPTERRLFTQPAARPVSASAVSFLLDCSGSMKEHGEALATLVDAYARALDRAGVPCEVLGFTTGAWNGGRALRDWKRAGAPPHPGRLNEVQHLVFKDADSSWRSSRLGLAALLKTTLYREGIDGEAVEWAAARLAGRSERHRILFVVSDGSPSDGATALANDDGYLGAHLASAVRGAEAAGTTVVGVGLGLDMSPFFRRSTILDPDRLGTSESVADLLGVIARLPAPPR